MKAPTINKCEKKAGLTFSISIEIEQLLKKQSNLSKEIFKCLYLLPFKTTNSSKYINDFFYCKINNRLRTH